MPYSDYITLIEGYHPVISSESIKDPKNRWQETYPHETFINLLKSTARMLERPDGHNDAKKPIWINGAYGTGKSRIGWTLGSLLTCRPEELADYFNTYPDLRHETELRQKLLGLKNGDQIVVAFNFHSSEIRDLSGLIQKVYQTVSEALEERGLDTLAQESLLGGLISWLEDDINQKMLTQILSAPPYSHDGDLPPTGAETLVRLKSGQNTGALLHKLMQIASERKLLAISFDMERLCKWLKEVIAINNLKALVLIWDEFSDFFLANRNSFGAFQQLAQLSASTPFYLIIITHFIGGLFSENDPAAKVVIDRFQPHTIQLPDNIAFRLMGHALRVRQEKSQEWQELRAALDLELEEPRNAVKNMANGIDDVSLRAILPIHPYTALILKYIAATFDSNQRSMFNFLAADPEKSRAFLWFINNFGPEDEDRILSVDQLWDYFYATGEGSQGSGRQNVEQTARQILEVWPILANKLANKYGDDDTKFPLLEKVLKTVIILQALRSANPRTEIFKATDRNLAIAFGGIYGLDNGIGLSHVADLCKDKILFKDQDIYQVPMGNAVDEVAIREIKDNLRKTTTSAIIAGNINAWDVLPPCEALKRRIPLRKLFNFNFKRDLAKFVNESGKPWEIKFALLLAHSPEEASLLQEHLEKALENPNNNNIFFIDATSSNMDQEKFEDYLQAQARQTFFASKDASQANREAQLAGEAARAWKEKIAKGKFRIYSSSLGAPKFCASGEELIAHLKELVRKKFPQCCDFLPGVLDTYFNAANIAAINGGLGAGPGKPITKDAAEKLLGKLGGTKYWETEKEHPISQLREALGRRVNREFGAGGSGRISISSIINNLLEKGFMPNALSAYLTGFLLRDFSNSDYRASDGDLSEVMTPQKMAEMIRGYYQQLGNPSPRYREQYIEVMTRDQRECARLCKEVFNLAGNESLELIAQRLRKIVQNWGYPLWAMTSHPDATELTELITLFGKLINPGEGSSYGDIANQIGALSRKQPEAQEKLKLLMQQENLQAGMERWLAEYEDGVFWSLANEIHAQDPLRDVRRALPEGFPLWSKSLGIEEIAKIIKGYRMAAESMRRGFLTHANSREECLEGWREKLGQLHLPMAALRDRYPDLKADLKRLLDLVKSGRLLAQHEPDFLEMITLRTERLKEMFDNSCDLFKSLYSNLLCQLSEEDKNSLYRSLPASSFADDRSVYENELKVKADSLASKKRRNQLCAFWEEKTGSKTPSDLAHSLDIPLAAILLEFANCEYDDAMRALATIENISAGENELITAMKFWQTNESLLATLTDKVQAETAFARQVIGKRQAILCDAALVRAKLRGKFGPNPNAWLANPAWSQFLDDLAREEYQNGGAKKVADKIAAMADGCAKALLIELGSKDYNVGLKILAEGFND